MEVDDVKEKGLTNILLYDHLLYGKIAVPSIAHKDREYGGHLMISPHVKVSHMHQLYKISSRKYIINPKKFLGFQTLCLVSEIAMLELINSKLSDSQEGVINYFEAGNWQFHTDRDISREKPGMVAGVKKDGKCKTVHVHMYGRSPLEPSSTEEERILHWGWGEAPYFPRFHETPFAPSKVGKKWIVPERFNEDEIKFFKKRLEQIANSFYWP